MTIFISTGRRISSVKSGSWSDRGMSEAGWTRSSDILNSKVAWAAAGSNVGRVIEEKTERY